MYKLYSILVQYIKQSQSNRTIYYTKMPLITLHVYMEEMREVIV